MATSITSRCCQRSLKSVFKYTLRQRDNCYLKIRNYARGSWRGLQDVLSADEEKQNWNNELKSKNPRNNAYVPFESQDPVHRSMASKSWERSAYGKLNIPLVPNKKRLADRHNLEERQKPVSRNDNNKSFPSYEKLDDGDTRFGQAIMSAKSRKEREKKNLILLEGYRLIQDAIDSGATAKCIYFSDKDFLDRLRLAEGIPLYKVLYRHLKIWSDTQAPAGIMALFEKPKQGECPSPVESCLPLTLICDNVRDPGNMGTLIRSAAAVGCQKILTTKGCVDVWDPKVIRAGMGSHFHIPILSAIPWELLLNYINETTQVLIAGTGKEDHINSKSASLTLEDIEELSTEGYKISVKDDKQMFLKDKYSSFVSDGKSDLHLDKAFLDKDHVKQFNRVPLQCISYDKVNCTESEVALVIGGETTGVSPAAKKFAYDRYGQCVTVPMSPVVNSLNSAIAASIILYEIRKQLILKQH